MIKILSFAKPRVFNVKNFGAKGDGVTNDGPAIQAALTADSIAGGGTVYFPNGIYVDTDPIKPECNCQIRIPQFPITSTKRPLIILKGESMSQVPGGGGLSLGAATLPPTVGSIIYSKLTSFSSAGNSIIGTNRSSFTATSFQVENIGLEVLNNPSGTGPVVGGINWAKGENCKFSSVQVFIDTSGYRSTVASNDVTGIETPDNSSGENYSISNCLVQGFRTGYTFGEHVVFNNSNVMACYYGFKTKFGNHASTSLRVGAYWCAYDIYAGGALVLSNFKIDAEWQQVGKWYDDIATIKDSANLLSGQVYYTVVVAGSGIDNTKFIKSGGSNLNTLSDAAGVASAASAGMAIGRTVTSGTAGSIPYLGTSGVLRQSNSNLFYDSANVRVGIGTDSPATQLDILSTNPTIRINNSSTTTGQLGIAYHTNGTAKWSQGVDYDPATNKHDYFIYNNKIAKAIFYADSTGMVNIGGTANVAGTSAISISSTNDITANLGTLTVGNMTATTYGNVRGATSSGGNMTLSSTSNATKGKILFGTSAYDEVNNRLGIGTTSPTNDLQIDNTSAYSKLNATSTSGQAAYLFAQSGTVKWQFGMNFSGGSSDFYIYDQANLKVRQYINTTGDIYLGGAASTTSTAVIGFKNNNSITVMGTNTTVGTTGAQTINKPTGAVNFAAGASTLVVTNSLATATSQIFLQVDGTDATATSARVTPAAGSFTITLNAAATAETRVSFWVIGTN